MTPAETPTECEARKENTTGLRQAVWDLFDEDADLNQCRICGHEYFSDDNWDDIDPHAVEYAEHLNHHTRVIQEKDARIRELEGGRSLRFSRANLNELILWGRQAKDQSESVGVPFEPDEIHLLERLRAALARSSEANK